MQNKKGNVTMIAIIIVVVTVTAGVIGWMFAKKSQAPASMPQPVTRTQQPIAPVAQTQPEIQQPAPATSQQLASIPTDWKTYSSSKYGFSISYPSSWTATELTSDNSFREGISFNESKSDPANTYAQLAIFYYNDLSGVSYTNKQPGSLDDYMKDPTFKDAKEIAFNGEKAFSATNINNNANVPKGEIFVQRQGHIYEINYFNNDKDIATTNAVIKTLKFTN